MASQHLSQKDSSGYTRLFVADVPNINASLARESRPPLLLILNWRALQQWLRKDLRADDQLVACLFSNMPPSLVKRKQSWAKRMRRHGYDVFLKPQVELEDGSRSDIDEDMVDFIRQHVARGGVAQIIILSHDARNFREIARECVDAGIEVIFVGIYRRSQSVLYMPGVRLVDIMQIPEIIQLKYLATKPEPRS